MIKVLVDVDSMFEDPLSFRGSSPLGTVGSALDKLLRCGWLAVLWTTRPLNQTVQIVETLKDVGLWEKFQLLSEGKVLHTLDHPLAWDYSIKSLKLSLLEKAFGEDLDQGNDLVAIERDPLEAAILKEHAKGRVIVHRSPEVWADIITINPDEMLTELLATERTSLPSGSMIKEDIPNADIRNRSIQPPCPEFSRSPGLAITSPS